MRTNLSTRQTFLIILLYNFVTTWQVSSAQVDDMIPGGSPGYWPKMSSTPCCTGDTFLRKGVQNSVAHPLDCPILGYPLRASLFSGINDTTQVIFEFENRSDSTYSLVGMTPVKWFRPRVFQNQPSSDETYLLRDSTGLGYRIRCWYEGRGYGWKRVTPPSLLAAPQRLSLALCMDIWNLPEGTNCLCLDTAKVATPGFKKNPASYLYEYRNAQSLADSVNAYEACYWRMVRDSNMIAAEQWSIKILDVNSESVPGWWIRARYYLATKDSAMAIIAYDKAISHLNANDDRAMPGFANSPIQDEEQQYIYFCKEMLKREREQFGP